MTPTPSKTQLMQHSIITKSYSIYVKNLALEGDIRIRISNVILFNSFHKYFIQNN